MNERTEKPMDINIRTASDKLYATETRLLNNVTRFACEINRTLKTNDSGSDSNSKWTS